MIACLDRPSRTPGVDVPGRVGWGAMSDTFDDLTAGLSAEEQPADVVDPATETDAERPMVETCLRSRST